MNKKDFLNKLREKIKILNNDEVEDIINEYSEHIDEKVKSGVSEEEAIREFGDFNELVTNILEAYKINKNYNNGESNIVNDLIDSTKSVFNKTIKIISSGTFKDILQLLIYILIALIICAFVKIPFYFIEDGFESIISPLPYRIYNVISSIVSVVINIIYIIVAYVVFIKLMSEKILNNFELNTEIDNTKKKNINNKKIKEGKVEKNEKMGLHKNDNSFMNFIGKVFIWIFKFNAFLILIIAACALVAVSVLFAVSVEFSLKYYLFLGAIIGSFGLLLGTIWICEILYRFIFDFEYNKLRLLITFIVAVVLFGSGIGLFAVEVAGLDFTDVEPEYILKKEYTFDTNVINKIECDYCKVVNKNVVKDMEDGTIIVKVYGPEYSSPYYYEHNYSLGSTAATIYYRNSTNKLLNRILDDVKHGKFYNYDVERKLEVTIEGNKNTLDKIGVTKCLWCD